jgi:hypothetical protein
LQVLRSRFEAGRRLERGVLADMKGEPSSEILGDSLEKLQESRAAMDKLSARFEQLRDINRKNRVIPEYEAALGRILRNHPAVERVSLRDARFANVARGSLRESNKKPIGSNLDQILGNIIEDLTILKTQLDQTIEAFRQVLPVAKQGGFAAMVLSGRAALPEKVLQSADMALVYAQFYNRACMTTIAADMQVYPKGLEWLKKPVKGWSGSSDIGSAPQ